MQTLRNVVVIVIALVFIVGTASAGAYVGVQLAEGTISPFVVAISQAVPVEISAPVELESGEVVTVTAPITVSVELRVSVAGQGVTTVVGESEPEIRVSDRPESLVDALGIPYTVEIDSPHLTLAEWTTYIDTAERINVTGEVRMPANIAPFKDVRAEMRFYGANGELVHVDEINSIGTYLIPGGYARFDSIIGFIAPDEISRYTVKFRVQE